MASHLRAGIFASISLLFIVSALFMQGCGGSSASAGGGGRGNPPATPTGLAATPSNHQVSLTWNTTTTASSYNVKRSTTSGGPYTHVANATVSNDTDTGLANGTTYYYVVSAVNANGESANSSEVSGTPNIPPPGVPTGLTATAANLQVALAWNAITGATSYNVKRATTTGGPYAKVGSSTVATYTETGLSNGTAYYYVVSAVNANGESGNSTEASATPATVSPDVTVIVDPTQTKPISPWIYGINFYSGVTGAPAHLTFDRAGGNRWTAYNWEPMHPMRAATTSTTTTTI